MVNLLKFEFISSIKTPRVWQLFLAMIGLTLFLFPTGQASYAVIDINGFRGIYNSAWIGESLALVSSWIWLLAGFYFVVGDITKARQSGVLALLLSSRFTVTQFLCLKFLSRLFLLLAVNACMLLTAIVQQRFLGESVQWDLSAYLLPTLVLVLPVLIVAVAFSILFEVVPMLRGKICNAVYFVVWSLLCMVNLSGLSAQSAFTTQMERALGQSSGLLSGNVSIGITPTQAMQQTFVWHGADYNMTIVNSAMLQAFLGLFVLLSAVVLANRRYSLLKDEPSTVKKQPPKNNRVSNSVSALFKYCLLWPTRKLPVLNAELQVLITGLSVKQRWVFVIISCVALVIPHSGLVKILLPLAAIAPMFVLSRLSNRDSSRGTDSIIRSVCAVNALLLNRWIACAMLLTLVYIGLLIRFAVNFEIIALLHVIAFICLVPALALLSGQIWATSKWFELIYLVIWFAGPLNKQDAFDLIGVTGTDTAMINMWSAFAVVSGILCVSTSYKIPVRKLNWVWQKLGFN